VTNHVNRQNKTSSEGPRLSRLKINGS